MSQARRKFLLQLVIYQEELFPNTEEQGDRHTDFLFFSFQKREGRQDLSYHRECTKTAHCTRLQRRFLLRSMVVLLNLRGKCQPLGSGSKHGTLPLILNTGTKIPGKTASHLVSFTEIL